MSVAVTLRMTKKPEIVEILDSKSIGKIVTELYQIILLIYWKNAPQAPCSYASDSGELALIGSV